MLTLTLNLTCPSGVSHANSALSSTAMGKQKRSERRSADALKDNGPGKDKRKRDDEDEDGAEFEEDGHVLSKSLVQKLVTAVKRALGRKDDKERKDPTKSPPFNISPSKTDYETYMLNNPFVEIVEGPGVDFVDGLDKVRLAKAEPMDVEAIQTVVDEILSFTPMESKATELGYRDIHVNFIKPIVRFTVPGKPSVKTSIRQTNKRQKLTGDSGQEGLYLSFELVGDTDPSDSDLNLRYEGDADTPTPVASSDRFDIRVMVYDSRIKEGNNLVTVAYVECKKNDDDLYESLPQAATYAKSAAMENMGKGRFSPIFLQGFSKTKWTHGMLIPFGTVTVKSGKVVDIDSVRKEDKETLGEVLEEATRRLRKAYPEHNRYPDGVYLSGVFYSNKYTEYPLPLQNGERDDARFYQTWLQIIAGNEVRKLNVEDLEARLKTRVQMYKSEYLQYKEKMATSRML